MDQAQAFVRDVLKTLSDVVRKFEPRCARNDEWLETTVLQPYQQAGSPYGDGPAAAIQWFREQRQQGQAGE